MAAVEWQSVIALLSLNGLQFPIPSSKTFGCVNVQFEVLHTAYIGPHTRMYVCMSLHKELIFGGICMFM